MSVITSGGAHSHAGAFFAAIAFSAATAASWIPMWLVSRKELGGRACSRGEGLWVGGGVEWGNLGEDCGEWDPISHCDLANSSSSSAKLCSELTGAQALSILSVVSWAAYWAACVFLGRICGARTRLLVLCASSFLAFCSSLIVFTLVNTGEMFSMHHYLALSKGFIRAYDGIGCVFQTPLGAHSISQVLSDSPLQCLFAGPGFVCGAIAFSVGFMSFGFHLLDLVRMFCSDSEPDRHSKLETCTLPVSSLCGSFMANGDNQITALSAYGDEESNSSMRVPMLGSTSSTQDSEASSDNSTSASSESDSAEMTPIVPSSSLYFVLRSEYGTCKALVVPLVVLLSLISLATFMCFQATTVSAIVTLGTEPVLAGADSTKKVNNVFTLREDVFDFTLIESIIYFFRGDAWMLAGLTLAFGLVWPYLKIFIWFVGYFLETRGERRYWVFGWLDTMGKWSFCNGFVLTLMMVAFYFENKQTMSRWLAPLLVPSHHEIVADIEVTVDPGIGTYAYIFNVLVSILVGHMLVLVDRHANAVLIKTSKLGRLRPTQSAIVEASALQDDSLILDHQHQQDQNVDVAAATETYSVLLENYTKSYQWGIAFGIFATAVFSIAGMVTPCYSFQFGGVIGGSVVPLEQRAREFSVLSTGLQIGNSGTGPSEAGIIYLGVLYFLLCMIIPLVRLVALWWVAHVPMKLNQHVRWLHIIEVLETYAALDVLLVSIVCTGFEITELSNAVLSSAFPGLETIVDSLLPQAGGLFAVQQSFLPGIWLLGIAVFLEKIVSFQIRGKMVQHLDRDLHLQPAAM